MTLVEMFIKPELCKAFGICLTVIRTIKIITLLALANLLFLNNITQRKRKLNLGVVCFK